MADLDALRADLNAEHRALDEIVARLDPARWDLRTPSEPWSVRDQISHLAFFDEQATTAVARPDEFAASLQAIAADVDGFMTAPLERGRAVPVGDVLRWWRDARSGMLEAFTSLTPEQRVPWFGPAMSPASFVTARLMETWAHGQDVVDGLGVHRAATVRLRHVAHIGVRARPFSYITRGLEPPTEPVAVVLEGPDGERWTWNEDAEQRVTGPAIDFCLVVTQRRHIDDTGIECQGDLASEWMSIAQAFAGPPGPGRRPGQFARGGAHA